MPDKPEKTIPFVITDRRKFSADGEPRPDADPSPDRPAREPEAAPATDAASQPPSHGLHSVTEMPHPIIEPGSLPGDEEFADPADGSGLDNDLPPAPTSEQMEQSRVAFNATADRLDIAIRAANPGGEHPPAMTFEQLIQSVYMQAILQLGGGAQPGQQPQIDLLGARQSIDMLGILDEKTHGNLAEPEHTLLTSALFELRLAFLEITQAMARSAQQRGPAGPGGGPGGMPPAGAPGRPGPSIVR